MTRTEEKYYQALHDHNRGTASSDAVRDAERAMLHERRATEQGWLKKATDRAYERDYGTETD